MTSQDDGYRAAGLLAYSLYDDVPVVLMVVERRNKRMGLSFPGGKREPIDDTPIHTAVREFLEETRCIIPPEDLGIDSDMVWYPGGKYYLANAWSARCGRPDEAFASNEMDRDDDDGIAAVAWIPIRSLLEWKRGAIRWTGSDRALRPHFFVTQLLSDENVRNLLTTLYDRCMWILANCSEQ